MSTRNWKRKVNLVTFYSVITDVEWLATLRKKIMEGMIFEHSEKKFMKIATGGKVKKGRTKYADEFFSAYLSVAGIIWRWLQWSDIFVLFELYYYQCCKKSFVFLLTFLVYFYIRCYMKYSLNLVASLYAFRFFFIFFLSNVVNISNLTRSPN